MTDHFERHEQLIQKTELKVNTGNGILPNFKTPTNKVKAPDDESTYCRHWGSWPQFRIPMWGIFEKLKN